VSGDYLHSGSALIKVDQRPSCKSSRSLFHSSFAVVLQIKPSLLNTNKNTFYYFIKYQNIFYSQESLHRAYFTLCLLLTTETI